MKTLETNRLVLRDMTTSDAEALYEILRDDNTAYWFGMPPMVCVRSAYRMIECGSDYQYGIVRKEDNKLIGMMQVGNTWSGPSKHIGYVLSSEARGNHYMKEAVDAVCEDLFENTDTDCITLEIREDNAPSRAVAASCGFFLNRDLPQWEKSVNYYEYPLDEFNRTRQIGGQNKLGDFLSEQTRLKLERLRAAA